MIEKKKVPQFGREETLEMPNGEKITSVIMESKESELIELAEKLNEVIDILNTLTK